MKIFNKILNAVAISLLIYFAIALGLIFSQNPVELTGQGGLEFGRQTAIQASDPAELAPYKARDGATLYARHYASKIENAPLVVLIHGSGWHGLQFDELARGLTDVADVIAPDLRGHGKTPERRGDVDYIGQLEDDIADLIAQYRQDGQKVVLAGHSSGGGLVVRFAGGEHGDVIDAAVLMAPFLKYNAPTTRENSGGWAQPLTRRIIGLSMLTQLNINRFNHLPVIQFNFPNSVLGGPLGHTATTAYSFRLNTAFAPRRDYLKDIAALPEFLLIAGTTDEAFVAQQYEPLMTDVTDQGQYLLVKDVSHLDIVNAPETANAIRAFLKAMSE
ncbi:MAG: pimeloyl-ACP methyl ester carboxylesterase [Planctomycetota bacterium]|jgi:pimeloyl-ACP methyl ester carboxylesterase